MFRSEREGRMSDKFQFVDSLEWKSKISDKLKEALIKYREAVTTSSPGLPPRLPWVSNFNAPQPRWGCDLLHAPPPNVAAERQRWVGGRYRFAVKKFFIALTQC
ncbi:MAG: hypothetical protein DMF76_27455 [Acidobacteria bacterium]|nr:MAG: hypothetical protein DMF76_27455 [Acidobacteriota bacterium]